MAQELGEVLESFNRCWIDLTRDWGFNRSTAEILATLYLSGAAMTAEELAEKNNVARSNVSTSIRTLESRGFITRAWVSGDRRTYYEATGDPIPIAATEFAQAKDAARKQMSQCREALKTADGKPAQVMRQRLDTLIRSLA